MGSSQDHDLGAGAVRGEAHPERGTHFRKRPVVVEAYEFWNRAGQDNRPRWLLEAVEAGVVYFQGGARPYLTIKTPGGDMRAELGDWIIRGVKGELYPCKPDIFGFTYEVVPERAPLRAAQTAEDASGMNPESGS